jgi:hypothetical protein
MSHYENQHIMRKQLLAILAFLPLVASAQTVSNFETPALPKLDTFFMDFNNPKQDIGINSGLAHFPLYTDSVPGFKFWAAGFTYSSMRDSISAGNGNQYSARPGKAVSGTQYAVAYGQSNRVNLLGMAQGKGVSGVYLTNGTYPYMSMKHGDAFARKFGDTTGTGSGLPQGSYPDFLRIIIRGYRGGGLKQDTVQFYLADFRSSDSTKDYIVSDWRWVSLLKLGAVDSLQFDLESTDTVNFGGTRYINTPLYFAMDDFTTNETVGVSNTPSAFAAKVYPNPATDVLNVELSSGSQVASITLYDMSGRMVVNRAVSSSREVVNMQALPAGSYLLQLGSTSGQTVSQRISKQ